VATTLEIESSARLHANWSSRLLRAYRGPGTSRDCRCDVSGGVLPLKVIQPLIESASLEDDQELRTCWANVLANAVDPRRLKESSPRFSTILKELTLFSARVQQSVMHSGSWRHTGGCMGASTGARSGVDATRREHFRHQGAQIPLAPAGRRNRSSTFSRSLVQSARPPRWRIRELPRSTPGSIWSASHRAFAYCIDPRERFLFRHGDADQRSSRRPLGCVRRVLFDLHVYAILRPNPLLPVSGIISGMFNPAARHEGERAPVPILLPLSAPP
jgi:hypothetical protein